MAADKYEVKSLRDICSKMLMAIDLSNVVDVLLLADLHGDKNLKDAALNFISKNYSRVKALENWSDLMKQNQTLAVEILSFIVEQKL